MTPIIGWTLLLLLANGAGPAAGQWYAWRDQQGALHVTDQFATIPQDAGIEANALSYGQPSAATSDSAPPVEAPQAAPEAASKIASDPFPDEIARQQRAIAARQMYLQQLRVSTAARTPAQLQMENVIEDEIRNATDAIARLRQQREAAGR